MEWITRGMSLSFLVLSLVSLSVQQHAKEKEQPKVVSLTAKCTPMGAHCELTNDPHITTFDGYRYDWHGTCNYSVTQSDFSLDPHVGVFSDFEPCNAWASCLGHTTFRDNPNTIITMRVSSLFLVRHCSNRLDVIAHPAHMRQLDGLCGHFNGYQMDDFTSRQEVVHPLQYRPLAFPLSWLTDDQCEEKCKDECPELMGCEGEGTHDPCTLDHDGEEWRHYWKLCWKKLGNIVGKDVKRQHYIETCAFDLCMLNQNNMGEREEFRWLEALAENAHLAMAIPHFKGG
ncbi:mucin-2-like [Homarus americanus]|uniref:mucin-2-like n=1 Tax=Homarus americanus TaxID=6706 RepID=UPI001C44FA21|nr:mucin-2-like [Homarus americanus]